MGKAKVCLLIVLGTLAGLVVGLLGGILAGGSWGYWHGQQQEITAKEQGKPSEVYRALQFSELLDAAHAGSEGRGWRTELGVGAISLVDNRGREVPLHLQQATIPLRDAEEGGQIMLTLMQEMKKRIVSKGGTFMPGMEPNDWDGPWEERGFWGGYSLPGRGAQVYVWARRGNNQLSIVFCVHEYDE